MIKISSKFNKEKDNQYYHADWRVDFDRVEAGIGWPGDKPGMLVVVGETEIKGEINRFLLAEATADSFGELLEYAIKLQNRFRLKQWHTVFVPGAERYLEIFDSKQFAKGEQRVVSVYEPLETDDFLQIGVEVVLDSLRAGNKNLHLFGDSAFQGILLNLPEQTSKLKIIDYPAVASLGYVLTYLEEFKKPQPYIYLENDPY